MTRAKSIEKHPRREQIDEALTAGESCRSIASWAGVSYSTVSRYASTRAAGVQPIANPKSGTVIRTEDPAALVHERVDWIWNEIQTGVEETHERTVDGTLVPGDVRARASLLNVARGVTETEAKLRGLPGFVPQRESAAGAFVQVAVYAPTLHLQPNGGEADPIIEADVSEIAR